MDGSSDAPQPTAAERRPIRVHRTDLGWQVDYGSYVQGYHASRDAAIEEATQAARREGRGLSVDPEPSGGADDRDRIGAEADRLADERDRVADERDIVEDWRDKVADDRERIADEADKP
jgi:hypothetical protein